MTLIPSTLVVSFDSSPNTIDERKCGKDRFNEVLLFKFFLSWGDNSRLKVWQLLKRRSRPDRERTRIVLRSCLLNVFGSEYKEEINRNCQNNLLNNSQTSTVVFIVDTNEYMSDTVHVVVTVATANIVV